MKCKCVLVLSLWATTFPSVIINAQVWSSVGTGTNNFLFALAKDTTNNILYAGGGFSTAGGVLASNIAAWDGAVWDSVGSGTDNTINCFAFFDGALYAGGQFTNAGGNTANRIARWDGLNWANVGTGMNSHVYTLTSFSGDLIAGGLFNTAGGSAASRIAKWDSVSWNTLGSGMSNAVNALTVFNGELYAGGIFISAGGDTVNYLAKWGGVNWLNAGSGTDGPIYSLTEYGGELYVGGSFTDAGGITVDNIAKWNGSIWSSVGLGVDNTVFALSVYNNELYIGGLFSNAGSIPANYIAKWDGNDWDSLGSGLNGQVRTLLAYDNELYVGGVFSIAGGDTANNVAKWYMPLDTCLVNPPLINNLSTVDLMCNGDNNGTASLTATGGTLPFTYLWTDSLGDTIGVNSPTIFGLLAASYTVAVYDVNGCLTTNAFMINEPTVLTGIIANTKDMTCFGICDGNTSVAVNGGATPYTYLWNNGQTTSTADSLCFGMQSVFVTDSNNCSISNIVNISQPTQLLVSISNFTNVVCLGDSTGSATVSSSGGTPPYTYAWNDPASQTVSIASGLSTGTYVATVIDSQGCIAIDSVTIDEPSGMVLTIDAFPDTSNSGVGKAWVEVSSSAPPYLYQWNDPGSQTTDTAYNLTIGTYTVIVTDSNGCVDSSNVTVGNVTDIANKVLLENYIKIYPNPFSGTATVELSRQSANSKRQLCIYDVTGRKVKVYSFSNGQTKLTLRANEIGTGMFFIHFISDGNIASIKKVVITEQKGKIPQATQQLELECEF